MNTNNLVILKTTVNKIKSWQTYFGKHISISYYKFYLIFFFYLICFPITLNVFLILRIYPTIFCLKFDASNIKTLKK